MNVSMACKTDDILCSKLPGLYLTTPPPHVPLHTHLLELRNRGIKAIRNFQGNRTHCLANLPMPSILCWRSRPCAPMQPRPTR